MKELICIGCPRGCRLQVDEENGYKVTGNNCAIGERYGREELINPTRMLTTSVRIENCEHALLPVRTEKAIPKHLLLKAMEVLDKVHAKAPVKMHDVIVENLLNTGVNVIASRSMDRKD